MSWWNWLFKKKEVILPILPIDYPVAEIDFYLLVDKLDKLGIVLQLKKPYMPDAVVRYTSSSWWIKIAPYLVSPADKYIQGICDCDDYARMATARSVFDFGLNGCLECWGTVGKRQHAFNLLVCSDNQLLALEPNAGFPYAGIPFEPALHGYKPTSWRL